MAVDGGGAPGRAVLAARALARRAPAARIKIVWIGGGRGGGDIERGG